MRTDRTAPVPDRRKDLFYFGLFLVLFLFTFREFFFTGRVFFERDTTVVEIPARKLTAALLREGNFALWTDAYGGGQPFLANPKNAVFYPATLLYLVLPLFTAFKLYYLIHVVLGWLGLYALCRSYALSERASFLGASLFAFSGMYLSSFEFYNHIAALAWMPWVLLLLDRGSRTASGRSRFIGIAVLWALLILAGSPEVIVITALLAAAQAFMRPGEGRRRLVAAFVPLAAACLLAAVQLAPSFEMLAQTGRESQSIDWPLELLQLPNMAFPDVLGNDREPGHHDFWGWHLFDRHYPLYYSLYMGFGALLLFLFALRRPWDRRRKVLLAAFGVLFLLACGRYSPFFFLYRFTPFLSSIRYPVKFFLGSVFCLSILAGAGLDDAMGGRAPGRRPTRRLVAAAGLALVLYLAFRDKILAVVDALMITERAGALRELGRSLLTGLILLVVCAAAFLLLTLPRARKPAAWTLMALAVLDPAYHNRFVNPTVPASFYDRPPLLDEFRPPLTVYRATDYFLDRREKSGSNVRFLAYYRESLYPLTAMAEGVRYVFDFDFYGTYPKRYGELVRAAKALPAGRQFKVLDSLGCRYLLSDSPMFDAASARRLLVEGFPFFIERISDKPASPYAVFTAMTAREAKDKLELFASPGFDPRETVLTEADVLKPPADGVQPSMGVRVVTVKETAGRGTYSLDMPRPGVAVFPGNYARGWRAWVDGKRAGVFEANLFAKGVAVAAGRHTVVLRYLPASFAAGALVSALTAVAFPAAALVGRRRLRRRGRPASA
ncbi:MAG TPA: YfhO family protein [Terriglobales bacterium]|nr:YfhO family protein [Terriglobales bacterium]